MGFRRSLEAEEDIIGIAEETSYATIPAKSTWTVIKGYRAIGSCIGSVVGTRSAR